MAALRQPLGEGEARVRAAGQLLWPCGGEGWEEILGRLTGGLGQ